MKTADVWGGYVGYTGDDRLRFATWSGGVLGKVTSCVTEERVRRTPSGGQYRMRHAMVQTPDGSTWQGRCGTAMDAITIRRVTKKSDDGKAPKVLRDLLKF
ncbi:hypothetical protein ABZ379_06190 [Streptomyces canus]|uniref:hypothetical protein n=1 Tax=Streptomyces canus TaxID=58343 RepID=UPI0033CD22A7